MTWWEHFWWWLRRSWCGITTGHNQRFPKEFDEQRVDLTARLIGHTGCRRCGARWYAAVHGEHDVVFTPATREAISEALDWPLRKPPKARPTA